MERPRKFAKGYFNTSKPEEENTDSSFVTGFKEEKFSFTWRIENIHKCGLKHQEFFESPTFSTRFCGEVKWALRIYPRGVDFKVYPPNSFPLFNPFIDDRVGLYLHRISTNPVNSTFKYHLSCERLLSGASKEIYTYTYPNNDELFTQTDFFSPRNYEVPKDLYGTSYLYSNDDYKVPETLVIGCDIYVTNILNMGAPSNDPSDLPKSCTLFQDLKQMFKSGKFSDITLQAGDMKFLAHKNILASRSKVFDAMFQHDMKETQSGVIKVKDIEPAVLSTLLQYIYTGIVDDFNMEKALSLYSVADKYFLEELKNWCVNIMLENMTVENVCHIAILAELHPDAKLKEATLNLFRNCTGDIFKRKEWRDLVGATQHHALVSEILGTVSTYFTTNWKSN